MVERNFGPDRLVNQDLTGVVCPRTVIRHRPWMNPRIELDSTLKKWPAPGRAEPLWEERAGAIVRAALIEDKHASLLDALMNAPPLLPELGEPNAFGGGGAAEPLSKHSSLREMAERHASRVLLLKRQKEAAANARAASEGVFNDAGKSAAAPARAPTFTAAEPPGGAGASASPSRAAAAAAPAKKRSGGFIAGAAIAALGLAAAFAIVQRDRLTPPSMPSTPAPAEARQDGPADPPLPEQAPPPAEHPAAPPEPIAATKAPRVNVAAPLPTASTAPKLAQGQPTAAPTAEVKPGPTETDTPSGPDDIESKNITGIPRQFADSGDKNSSVPQQPAPGSVAVAFRPFMGGAKKCVAGANDASRATVTFGSDGSVKSIAVSGWAESNGATGCITSALKGANIGRFWKPSFTVTVPIRP
jgi:hypothetical protein